MSLKSMFRYIFLHVIEVHYLIQAEFWVQSSVFNQKLDCFLSWPALGMETGINNKSWYWKEKFCIKYKQKTKQSEQVHVFHTLENWFLGTFVLMILK